MRRYAVVLTPEAVGGYSVVVPSCFSEGETVEEALAMARDAIATWLDGEPAADCSAPEGVIVAEVDVAVEERDGVLTSGRLAPAAD